MGLNIKQGSSLEHTMMSPRKLLKTKVEYQERFQVIFKQYEPLNSKFDKMISLSEGQQDKLCDILLLELGIGQAKAKQTGKEVKPSDNIQDKCDYGQMKSQETIDVIAHYISNVIMQFFQGS